MGLEPGWVGTRSREKGGCLSACSHQRWRSGSAPVAADADQALDREIDRHLSSERLRCGTAQHRCLEWCCHGAALSDADLLLAGSATTLSLPIAPWQPALLSG